MIPSLEGWTTKAKEAPSPHELRLTPLDTNPVLEYLGGKYHPWFSVHVFVSFIEKKLPTTFYSVLNHF